MIKMIFFLKKLNPLKYLLKNKVSGFMQGII